MSDDKPLVGEIMEDMDKDAIIEQSSYTLVGAGVGGLVAGPIGLVVGGILGFLIGAAKYNMEKGEGNESPGKEEPGTEGNGESDE
jgi:hypothetical protein